MLGVDLLEQVRDRLRVGHVDRAVLGPTAGRPDSLRGSLPTSRQASTRRAARSSRPGSRWPSRASAARTSTGPRAAASTAGSGSVSSAGAPDQHHPAAAGRRGGHREPRGDPPSPAEQQQHRVRPQPDRRRLGAAAGRPVRPPAAANEPSGCSASTGAVRWVPVVTTGSSPRRPSSASNRAAAALRPVRRSRRAAPSSRGYSRATARTKPRRPVGPLARPGSGHQQPAGAATRPLAAAGTPRGSTKSSSSGPAGRTRRGAIEQVDLLDPVRPDDGGTASVSWAASSAPTGLSTPLIAMVRPAGSPTSGTGTVTAVVGTNRRGATPAGPAASGRSTGCGAAGCGGLRCSDGRAGPFSPEYRSRRIGRGGRGDRAGDRRAASAAEPFGQLGRGADLGELVDLRGLQAERVASSPASSVRLMESMDRSASRSRSGSIISIG